MQFNVNMGKQLQIRKLYLLTRLMIQICFNLPFNSRIFNQNQFSLMEKIYIFTMKTVDAFSHLDFLQSNTTSN